MRSAQNLQPTGSCFLILHRTGTSGCQENAIAALERCCKLSFPLPPIRKWELMEIGDDPAAIQPPTQHLKQQRPADAKGAIGQRGEFQQDGDAALNQFMGLPVHNLDSRSDSLQLCFDDAGMIGEAARSSLRSRDDDQHMMITGAQGALAETHGWYVCNASGLQRIYMLSYAF